MFWRAIIMNRLHYRQAQGHIFASTPMLRSAFVKKSPLQKQLLMMQFENDSYNSWCKFVMEPGDIGATNSWATNATYLDMSDPACQ